VGLWHASAYGCLFTSLTSLVKHNLSVIWLFCPWSNSLVDSKVISCQFLYNFFFGNRVTRMCALICIAIVNIRSQFPYLGQPVTGVLFVYYTKSMNIFQKKSCEFVMLPLYAVHLLSYAANHIELDNNFWHLSDCHCHMQTGWCTQCSDDSYLL